MRVLAFMWLRAGAYVSRPERGDAIERINRKGKSYPQTGKVSPGIDKQVRNPSREEV